MKTIALTSLLAIALLACSSSDSGNDAAATTGGTSGSAGSVSTGGSAGSVSTGGSAGQSGGSGGASAGASQAGTGGTAGAGGMGPKACDPIADPAGLPTVNGTFVQFVDAPKITTTGGDPTGTWFIEKSVSVLPKIAMGQVDIAKSSNVGTGYFTFGADKSFVSHTKFHVTLEIGVLGTQEQDTETLTKGVYVANADQLDITPECSSVGMQGMPPKFSVVGDKITLVLSIKSMQGDVTVIFEGKKAP